MTEAAPAEPRGARWARWINWAGLAFGVAGLAWILHDTGWDVLVAHARDGAWAIAACVGIDLAATALRARALHVLLRPAQRMVSFTRVAIATLAGSAIGVVTPVGAVGEATKVTMLLGRAPAQQVVSAFVAYQVISLYVSAAVLVIGAAIAAGSGGLPPALAQLLWLSAAVVIVAMVVVTWVIRRGVARTALGLVAGVGAISGARRDRWAGKLAELDERVRALQGRGGGAVESFAGLLGAKLLTWVQTWLAMEAIGVEVDAPLFIAVILGGAVVSRIAGLLPLGVGVGDAGAAALYHLVGLPARQGVLVTMLLRVRQVLLVAIGLAAMFAIQFVDSLAVHRTRQRLRARRAAGRPTA